jgi:hypothetical protein
LQLGELDFHRSFDWNSGHALGFVHPAVSLSFCPFIPGDLEFLGPIFSSILFEGRSPRHGAKGDGNDRPEKNKKRDRPEPRRK